MAGRFVCFGEMLVRMTAPAGETLPSATSLDLHIGGAEANVAACISRLGGNAAMATTLPDNALGAAARDALRRHGVDTTHVRHAAHGRMGLYFLTQGAAARPAEILYDRAHSAFALDPAPADAGALLDGAAHLHISGITPAVSDAARAAALDLVRAAEQRAVTVSFDGNYRARLWEAWGGDGPAALRAIFAHVDLAFIDARDIALILGRALDGSTHDARTENACKAMFDAFPKLARIVFTERQTPAPDHHVLAGRLHARGRAPLSTEPLDLRGVVDRIGGGDAFAGGFLFAQSVGMEDADALRFALHTGALKHAQRGDMPFASRRDVELALTEHSSDVRR